MEPIYYLLFTNNFIAIVFSLFLGYLIYLLISFVAKKELGSGLAAVCAFGIYMFLLYTPLPKVLNVELIKKLDSLEYNQVNSNGLINRILFACYDKNLKGVRGYKYSELLEAYQKDLESFSMNSNNNFKIRDTYLNNKMIEDGDLCNAAYYYNGLKNERLKSVESVN